MILNGLNSSWGQGINVTFDTTLPNNGITASNPNGGSMVVLNLVGDLPSQLITLTHAEAIQLLTDSAVEVGRFYFISDRADLGMLFQGEAADRFSLQGVGGYLNPDFQAQGDYSGVEAITGVPYTATYGVWCINIDGTLIDGDVVFWDGLHYQCVDVINLNGDNPATNVAAFTVLNKSETNVGYNAAYDAIEYDIFNDWIQKRVDKFGSFFAYSKATDDKISNDLGYSAIVMYQWGNNECINYINQGQFNNINFGGQCYGNVVNPLGSIWNVITENSGSVFKNNFVGNAVTLSNKNLKTAINYENAVLFANDDAVEDFTSNVTGRIMYTLSTYDDDAAAGVGGLIAKQLYQTNGNGAAPLNVAGIVMTKQ